MLVGLDGSIYQKCQQMLCQIADWVRWSMRRVSPAVYAGPVSWSPKLVVQLPNQGVGSDPALIQTRYSIGRWL